MFRRQCQLSVVPEQPSRPGALLAPVDERIQLLEGQFSYVHVTVDPHFDLGECGWCCPTIPEPSSVRVYGDPRHDDRVNQPLEVVEVCMGCALNPVTSPIRQAAMESKTSDDIRVEVSA
jgi:hypothetical protein